MNFIFISIFAASISIVSSECICESGRRLAALEENLPHHKMKPVKFSTYGIKGENYIRPHEPSVLYTPTLVSSNANGETQCSEQVHITLGGKDDEVIVTYVSYSHTTESKVYYSHNYNNVLNNHNVNEAKGTRESYSQTLNLVKNTYSPVMGMPGEDLDTIVSKEDTKDWAYEKNDPSDHWFNWKNVTTGTVSNTGAYNNPYMIYDSPIVFNVVIDNLDAGKEYFYQVADSCMIFNFTMPRKVGSYPYLIGLTADIGQTNISKASFDALYQIKPDVIILPGDLSYADGYTQFWDSYGRMSEPIAARIPILTTGGNHEIWESWLSYKARYPTPYQESDSTNFCYYAKNIGPVHLIALCSYAAFNESSLQYKWFKNHLETQIDRTKTPWLAVMMHAPFYSTNVIHWKEGELMRLAMEDLFYDYGVDFVLAGHVHVYERTHPTYNNKTNACGPTYYNLGDGGNYEGTYTNWRKNEPWSAFREASFGIGQIEIVNDTHAQYSWHRHGCYTDDSSTYHMNISTTCATYGDSQYHQFVTSDQAWLTKPPKSQCEARYKSTYTGSNDYSSDSVGSDDDGLTSKDGTIAALSVLFSISAVINFYLIYKFHSYMFEKAVTKPVTQTTKAEETLNPSHEVA